MSLFYTRSDSVGRRIIPAPIVSVSKKYNTNDIGEKRGTSYSIVLTGTLLPFRGSPSGEYASLSQAFYTVGGYPPDETYAMNNTDFDNILRKQEALRWLFSEDGGSLEWQPAGGQPPMKCYPRIISIKFAEGSWANRCNYTIELEAPWIYINGTVSLEDDVSTDLLSTSSEAWSFEETDGRNNQQYRVTHEVSAGGQLGYDGGGDPYENKQPWQRAKDWVDTKASGSIDSAMMFAALGATDQITGHYNNVVKIDKDGGTYSVTEEWVLSEDNSYEERQFTVEYNQTTGEYDVTYQGTIHGVGTNSRDGNVANMNQARSAIPSTSVARTTATTYVGSLLDGKSIPTYPSKKTFSLNQQDGTVNFTYQWSTSDSATFYITEEAQHSYSLDNQLNTLTFTQTVEGKGESSAVRLANAEGAIYTDAVALANAKDLANTILTYNRISIVKSFDKKRGVVKGSWTWTDRDAHGVEVNVQTQEVTSVYANIPIPGRASGPIVQDMGTTTLEAIVVTITSKRHTTKPTLNTVPYGEGGLIVNDTTKWNPQTGAAERTTRFLKEG